MDPPHITEFASERYFTKLDQLNKSSSSPQQINEASSSSEAAPTPSTLPVEQLSLAPSTFILPLRSSKQPESPASDVLPPSLEPKRAEKSLFSSFRSKFHLKSSHALVTDPTPEDSRTKSIPLDQLFLSLPNELQIQIISSLPLADILNLRLASKSWHTLITLNEAPIVRYHLDHHIPAYALRLYPATGPATASFHHLCGLWHRLHVAAKLSYLMCDWVTKEIFLRTTESQLQEFAPQRERMRRRLIPILFTVFHFFEMYRKLHLEHIRQHDGHGLLHEPYTLNPIEVRIMNMYDDQTLLRVHQFFPLIISSFCRRLRPPSYAGRVERSLRGYIKDRPSDELHVAVLCVGGLRQVERLWEIKGYNTRRGAVDDWYHSVSKEPVTETPASRSKRSFIGLGRKKSAAGLDSDATRKTSIGSLNQATLPPPAEHASSLVFYTSLAAGMPMSPLPHDESSILLRDLPDLRQIWMTTAEALILERKIVERTQDIKRNAQVMLDLIREDGMEEEDEWWYGRNAPESVKPPVGSLDGDTADGVMDDLA